MKYIKEFDEYINKPEINLRLILMSRDRAFSVSSYIDLIYIFLKNYDNVSKREWMQILYHYIVLKSFPHKNEERIKKELIPIYEIVLNKLSDINGDDYLTCIDIEPSEEYIIFKDAYRKYYIYELMQLDRELTGHNTLDHVIGVRNICLHIALQLKKLCIPIDIGAILGASLGHDIGKYGVLESSKDRVPYLHYYYTEEWFSKFSLEKIGHIATNHSTWDLELESLPIESLLLIYSDFRVKNRLIDGKYEMHIFTLKESFQIILDKLDNLDDAKTHRYKRVYSKLKDFEDFMDRFGVGTGLQDNLNKKELPFYSLLTGNEIVNYTKHLAINHNILLMSKLIDDEDFTRIMELARGEDNWRMLRLYLQIFKDYSTYLTQKQKIKTLHFLENLLLHKEEEIRKEAAYLIGAILAVFDEEYRKEQPDSAKINQHSENSVNLLNIFLSNLLYPNFKIADSQAEWLYNLKIIMKTLFEKCNAQNYSKYFDIINRFYEHCDELSSIAQFYLVRTIEYLPVKFLDKERLDKLYFYIIKKLNSKKLPIRLSIMDIIPGIVEEVKDFRLLEPIIEYLRIHQVKEQTPAENYMKFIIAKKVMPNDPIINVLERNYMEDEENISDIFLKNLKTATEWTIKKINIDILYDQVNKDHSIGFHTSMHLCNLIKVSSVEKVRTYAGDTLLNIFNFLSLEEKNDVCVELIRALEIENYQFTKFIPDYIGRLILHLPPMELDEVIDDFEQKLKVSNQQVIQLILNTIGITIQSYPNYKDLFTENNAIYKDRLHRLLGLLLIPITSFNIEAKTEAFRVISSKLFNSDILSLKDKSKIFNRIGKKLLTLMEDDSENQFLFFTKASFLNHIYRFISDFENRYGIIKILNNEGIAFFPGTFDPFSLSHTEIAKEIRDKGFEVYLAVDEFSWSKRTEPHKFRRDIINISTANEYGIYLFPKEIPINISNTNDLRKLKGLFPRKKVFIAVGTDVLLNASAYKNNGDILNYSHIVFNRQTSIKIDNEEELLNEVYSKIKGNIIKLSLPTQYEDISSSLIREGIDKNRDISKLIDPLAAEYIYKYGLYLREPQYKSMFETKTLDIVIKRELNEQTLDYLMNNFGHVIDIDGLLDLRNKLSFRIMILMDNAAKKPLGFSTFYWVRNSMLYDEFKDLNITSFLRKNTQGRTVIISGIYGMDNDEELIDIVLNETLSITINRDYNNAVYNNRVIKGEHNKAEEELKLQGFIETPFTNQSNSILLVDMTSPITLSFDLENMLKPPYNNNEGVLTVVKKTRKQLKQALSNLYPGHLVLALNKDMIYSKVIQKICDINDVPTVDTNRKALGQYMCVPFGIILNSTIIPNTVTKTIHTERIFSADLQSFVVGNYPNYLSLEEQSKTIKSFNKPIILVDDLLHNGYRLNMVEPILRKDNIEIKKVMVGILSGRGKEISEILNLDVEFAYFVPNLKLWFNESNQYPYLGGDMVKRINTSTIIPSMNYILPYVSPRFIKGVSNTSIYNLSETCLRNTYDILKTIEDVYQEINEKALNLISLGEVLKTPRYPDLHRNMELSKNIVPSSLVEMDLDYLKRLENSIKR